MSSKITLAAANRCDAIRELIPEYAFGLTNSEQTHFVEANLQHCAEAAAELADFQRMQAEMRADVAQFEPPTALESKLMAAIAEPVVATIPTPKPVAAPVPAPRRRIPVGWLVAAAAIIVLVLTNAYWLLRVNTPGQQGVPTPIDQPAFVLTSTSGLRWVRLPPADETADTSAFMMWNAASKIGLLYAHGFPKLAVGKTYQLWLTRGETRIGVGTFVVDENGQGALLFSSEEPIDEFTWARITDEPLNGSPQPSGPIVVIGKLSPKPNKG